MDVSDILNNTVSSINCRKIGHARRLLHSMRAIVADDKVVFSLVNSAITDLNCGKFISAKNDVRTANIVNNRNSFTMAL